MKYLNCIDCGKEKKDGRRQHCLLCSLKYRPPMSEETKLKMSVAKKGKVNSEQHRYNMSISRGGNGTPQKHPGLGAWSGRNKNKTPFCEWCYSEDNLEAHHILPKAHFPQYATDDSNCRVMCKSCHIICHKQGGF